MRRLILDAALQLFVEKGYEGVSIRAVASRIEYSPGTFYLYFRDKDEVLFHLHEEGFDELMRRQTAVLEGLRDPVERLRAIGRDYVQFALENPELYELMFIMKGPMRKIAEDANEEWGCGMGAYGQLRDTVQSCMDAGRIAADNVEIATLAMWSKVHGICALIIRDRLPMVPKEMLHDVAQRVVSVSLDLEEKP